MKIATDRLVLRPIQIEDKKAIFEYRSDAEANKFQGWIPRTVEEVEEFIGRVAKKIDAPGTWFQFVLLEKASDKLIGDFGLHFIGSENRQVEIGFTLSKSFQGKGYASEAFIHIVDYLFYTLKKHRIIASIDPENISSIKLVEKLGFRKEAHFLESIFLHGKWVDDVVYALLEKDWKK
jgi:RimJ/RimL family protein N-acetyltransferase